MDIWGRSQEKHKLRYVDFVGDGDCSSHRDVVKSKPYGETVVRKVECVGHIQKRMGGRLRRKKKDLKGKKLADGKTIGGRNRLTDNLIDTFQRYYGKALRQNKGDLPGMEKKLFGTTMPQLKTLHFMITVLKGLIHGASGSVIRQMVLTHSAQRVWPLL